MNSFVHRRLTRRWALEEGFAAPDAEELAQLTDGVDANKGDVFHPRNWRYHFGRFGAWELAEARLERASDAAGTPEALADLAVTLHAVQDGVGHGHYGPLTHGLYRDVDLWEARDEATRAEIERLTRQALRTYLAAVALAEERSRAGRLGGDATASWAGATGGAVV